MRAVLIVPRQQALTLPEIKITRIYGWCPVQADGTINGLPFYFRARHDYWLFAIAQTPDIDPVDVMIGEAPGFRMMRPYGRKGGCDASFMRYAQVKALIVTTAMYYHLNKSEEKND